LQSIIISSYEISRFFEPLYRRPGSVTLGATRYPFCFSGAVFVFHDGKRTNERAQSTGVPISGLHCPPVWGFVGSQKYVDVDRVVYDHHRRRSADGGGGEEDGGDKYLRTVLLLRSAGDLADVVNGGETDDDVRKYFQKKKKKHLLYDIVMCK